MGAPWISGIADIRSFAHELSVNVVENFKTVELYQRFWPWRPVSSPIFNFLFRVHSDKWLRHFSTAILKLILLMLAPV